ncbi:hypothetical protein [Aquabacterium humicola]|uniref:hypothetical protein n=1 Tax=Aquabacterium humicola TaxID=3237377 RepID=UPI0025439F0C|nr:hypothetical protein [Rubrivivax pictus]
MPQPPTRLVAASVVAGLTCAGWLALSTFDPPEAQRAPLRVAAATAEPGSAMASPFAPARTDPDAEHGHVNPPAGAVHAPLALGPALLPSEEQRVRAHLAFLDELARFRALRAAGQGISSDMLGLARKLEADLDSALEARQIGIDEGGRIKEAILEVLLRDPAHRRAGVDAWRARYLVGSADGGPRAPSEEARVRDFRRREAEIVAAWNQLPAEQRDMRRLHEQVEMLRHAIFGVNR